MKYIGNAFSPNMVPEFGLVYFSPVRAVDVPRDVKSIVGHESTAKVLSQLLDRSIPVSREAVSLQDGDELYLVAIFKDGKPFRPPEGKVLEMGDLLGLDLQLRRIVVNEAGRVARDIESGGTVYPEAFWGYRAQQSVCPKCGVVTSWKPPPPHCPLCWDEKGINVQFV